MDRKTPMQGKSLRIYLPGSMGLRFVESSTESRRATATSRTDGKQTEGNAMDVLRVLAVSEGASAILIAGTWYWVLRQGSSYETWRTKASFAALILASIAVVVQLVLAMITQVRPLEALDSTSLRGGWSAFAGHLWLWSFFATGLLSFAGVALALLGKGTARIPAGVWSFVVLGLFVVSLVLAVNSFH